MDIEVIHNAPKRKFYAIVDKHECYLQYLRKGATMLEYNFVFVPVHLRGRNIAGALAEAALDYAQKNNFQIIPSCSYVSWYMNQHSKFNDLRVENLRI